jgi:hypothetical protein
LSDDKAYVINTKGLDKLVKALKTKPPVARVGILSKNARNTQGPGNATIGAMHEFGTTKTPVRSFLRVPISEHLEKEMESSGALDKKVLADVVSQGTILPWLQKIAILAEGIVAQAFDTGGFGKWPLSNYSHKKNHQTLVETNQLRESITSEVK